jgi:transcriptional regulator of acetoin/glycerol metabolism
VVASGHVVQASDLGLPTPTAGATPAGPLESLDEVEHRHIATVLHASGGNISRAARTLGIDRVTLYHKMKKYSMRRDGAQAEPGDVKSEETAGTRA